MSRSWLITGSSRGIRSRGGVRDSAGMCGRMPPELNVLCGIADCSPQSDQPLTKHLVVEITAAQRAASGVS